MILQSLKSHLRRKTVIQAGLFVLKILLSLPFSLLAQTRVAVFTTAPIAFPAASSIQAFDPCHTGLVAVANNRP